MHIRVETSRLAPPAGPALLPPDAVSITLCFAGNIRESLMATRVTSKGQVTIPKRVRDHLGIAPGHRIDFELTQDGKVTLRRVGQRGPGKSRFDRIRGSATVRMTTEEIMKLTRGD